MNVIHCGLTTQKSPKPPMGGDGELTGEPCCSQIGYQIKLGNLRDNTLHGFWHSDSMKEIRQHMVDRTWEQIPTCNNCLKDLIQS